MPFEIDPRFREARSKSRNRRFKRYGKVALIGAAALLAVFGVGAGVLALIGAGQGGPGFVEAGLDGELTMTQVDTPEPQTITSAAFVDLRGDPMILRIGAGAGQSKRKTLQGPQAIPSSRIGARTADQITVMTDDLMVRQSELVMKLPSSREDLAFFQARRIEALDQQSSPNDILLQTLAPKGTQEVTLDDGSWGEVLELGEDAGPTQTIYTQTKIENTTSVVAIAAEPSRQKVFEDRVVVLKTKRALLNILREAGFSAEAAPFVAAGIARHMALPDSLGVGSVVALRLRPEVTGPFLLHISLYAPDGYIGTVAQIGAGRFTASADPWLGQDMAARSTLELERSGPVKDFRLLDAVYSAAIRNGVPTELVGETVVMLSRQHDLDGVVAAGDKVTLAYATNPGPSGRGAGQLLYAAIKGPTADLSCYVTPSARHSGGFECLELEATGGGMVTPVSGTLTSGFGPRMHPILKQLRNHGGVDWAAPTGTPVLAAADGKVSFAAMRGGYGNVVIIDHGGGVESRYAHLNKFSEQGRAGAAVKAGDVIGFVGTTGRSTGPHLHFEIHQNGRTVDPITFVFGTGGRSSGAVEALVNQIIKVESAGNANAKNPNSTATGLGQFINSTWLRMMRTYRPELVKKLSQAELLALRNNPELSREMVRNLARENESYLRARKHQITPGRLYLAHFLGPKGADVALRADGRKSVQDVMGAAVVRANGFLRGKTIADLKRWSDRKMGKLGGGAPQAPVRARRLSPADKAYKDAVDAFLTKV